MSAGTSSNVGNAALIVSGTGGLAAAVNEYAVIIGLFLSVVSIVIGLIFHIRADRWRAHESAEARAELTRQIMQELERNQEPRRTKCDDEQEQIPHDH